MAEVIEYLKLKNRDVNSYRVSELSNYKVKSIIQNKTRKKRSENDVDVLYNDTTDTIKFGKTEITPNSYTFLSKIAIISLSFTSIAKVKLDEINTILFEETTRECNICYEETRELLSCKQCTFKYCHECVKKIKKCPQCNISQMDKVKEIIDYIKNIKFVEERLILNLIIMKDLIQQVEVLFDRLRDSPNEIVEINSLIIEKLDMLDILVEPFVKIVNADSI